MANHTSFRFLREELLKLLHSLYQLDKILEEQPSKCLTLDKWEDVHASYVYLRIFPALFFNYADEVDRSQFEALKNFLLERNRYPGLELHDNLDRFATSKYVQARLENFLNYRDKDVTIVYDVVDKVIKFLKTLIITKRHNHIEGEEHILTFREEAASGRHRGG